jgi:hypothetical protein
MTTESETQEQQQATALAEESAAFEASFNDEAPKPAATPAPTPAPTEEAQPATGTEDVKGTEAAQTPAPSPAPAPAPFDAQAEIRKLNGRIGDLNSQLHASLKAKEEAGKPATLTPLEMKRMKEQYPELAEDLTADIADALATLSPKSADPKEIETLVTQRVQREMAILREAAVTDRHETWKTDLWVGGNLGAERVRTPEYAAWVKTLPEAEAQAFENSDNPSFVNRKLDQFYDWKGKAAKAKTDQEERLKANLTPRGVPRAGQQTISDEEAARKGFDEGFQNA